MLLSGFGEVYPSSTDSSPQISVLLISDQTAGVRVASLQQQCIVVRILYEVLYGEILCS